MNLIERGAGFEEYSREGKREMNAIRKKLKAQGAVDCKGCGFPIRDLECFITPNGSRFYHLHCVPDTPWVMAKGKMLMSFMRVRTPGKFKKNDNRLDAAHQLGIYEHCPWDDE